MTAVQVCADPVVDREAVRAVTEATLARLPTLIPPGPTSDTPTEPTCPGSRHGSYAAYKKHRCRCPEVRAYLNAKRGQQRVVRAALVRAGLVAQPSPVPADEGDVEAGLWAAKRFLPMPSGLRTAERVLIAHRLHQLPGTTWDGPMSAAEIGARIGRSSRQVQRYLDIDPAKAWAGEVSDVGDTDDDPAEQSDVRRFALRSTPASRRDVYAAA